MTISNTLISTRNPRTGVNDYEFSATSTAELQQIVERARIAQVAWENLGLEGRIGILEAWGERLKASREKQLAAVCADTGRYNESVREVDLLPRWIQQIGRAHV